MLYYTCNQCNIYKQVLIFQFLFSNILTEIINLKIEHNFENIQIESQQIQAAGRYRSEKKGRTTCEHTCEKLAVNFAVRAD